MTLEVNHRRQRKRRHRQAAPVEEPPKVRSQPLKLVPLHLVGNVERIGIRRKHLAIGNFEEHAAHHVLVTTQNPAQLERPHRLGLHWQMHFVNNHAPIRSRRLVKVARHSLQLVAALHRLGHVGNGACLDARRKLVRELLKASVQATVTHASHL